MSCWTPGFLNFSSLSSVRSEPVVDETPWETVANETPKEASAKPTKKSLHVGEFECVSVMRSVSGPTCTALILRSASAEPEGPHIAQVIDAEEAT